MYIANLSKQGAEENVVPKREDVEIGRRQLHNEEIHNWYSSCTRYY